MNQQKLVELLHTVLDRIDTEQVGRQGPVYANLCRAKLRIGGMVKSGGQHRPQPSDEFAGNLVERAEAFLPEGWKCGKPIIDGGVCKLRATFHGPGFVVHVFAFNSAVTLTERAKAVDTDLMAVWVEDATEDAHHLKGHAA